MIRIMDKRFTRWVPWLGLAAVDSAFAMIGYVLTQRYYDTHLPHYDSMGSYADMFLQMNVSARDGLWVSLALATGNALSWLQPMYAALVGPLLPAEPGVANLLNVLCLMLAQTAIVSTMLRLGSSWGAAFLGGLLPLLPAMFSGWNGGFLDMRRDLMLTLCLMACFFWSGLHALRPTYGVGLALGVSAGLAVWSRGNALPYLAMVMIPAFVTHVALVVIRRRPLWRAAAVSALPLIAMLGMTAPFYVFTLDQILDKYIYGAYAVGFDRLESLRQYMFTPVTTTFDQGSVLPVVALLGALAALTWTRVARWSVDHDAIRAALWFGVSGAVACLLVVAFNSLVVGVSPLGGAFPYFPSLVGLLGVLAAPLLLLRPNTMSGSAMFGVSVVALAVTASVFLYSHFERSVVAASGTDLTYAAGDGTFSAERVLIARELSDRLACLGHGKLIAFVWVGSVNRPAANFYVTQLGQPRLANYESLASLRMGTRIDLERPAVPGIPVEDQLRDIERSFDFADLIVVSEDPSQYQENPMSYMLIYKQGRPVIERLLASDARPVLYRFAFDKIPFVVLGAPGSQPPTACG